MREGIALNLEASGTARHSRRGSWRASIPASAVFAHGRASQRQSRPRLARLRGRQWKPPASFLSFLLSLVLFGHASALPTFLGFCFLRGHAPVVTMGCKKAVCCTALCYVDKDGIHHCVHAPGGDSCECSQSMHDPDQYPVLLSTIGTLPDLVSFLPALVPTGRISLARGYIETHIPSVPAPPPK
jgi:hypothetical protein